MSGLKTFALILALQPFAVATDLPVRFLSSADKTKPLVFYISGDGGWNNFSNALLQSFNRQGFPVVGLDAKTYFWNRKSPEQTAQEVASLLEEYHAEWRQRALVFIGYSFGADVMPFVQTRLPKAILQHLKATLLISPSEHTDFEVHLLDLFSGSSRDSFDVMEEITKLTQPVTLFFGADEKTEYAKPLASKGVAITTLAGGHHYNNDMEALTTELIKHMAP